MLVVSPRPEAPEPQRSREPTISAPRSWYTPRGALDAVYTWWYVTPAIDKFMQTLGLATSFYGGGAGGARFAALRAEKALLSRLGPQADALASSIPGRCLAQSNTLGKRLFEWSDAALRPDVWGKVGRHYHLRSGKTLIDPTVHQFFRGASGIKKTFMGTEKQLVQHLDRLIRSHGLNREIVGSTVQTADDLFRHAYQGAELITPGTSLHFVEGARRMRVFY